MVHLSYSHDLDRNVCRSFDSASFRPIQRYSIHDNTKQMYDTANTLVGNGTGGTAFDNWWTDHDLMFALFLFSKPINSFWMELKHIWFWSLYELRVSLHISWLLVGIIRRKKNCTPFPTDSSCSALTKNDFTGNIAAMKGQRDWETLGNLPSIR